MRCLRRAVKSACCRKEGRAWKEEIMYRWKRSAPAEGGMGLRWESRRTVVWWERRARVSAIVVSGFSERRAISDSIAASAGDIEGSRLVVAL